MKTILVIALAHWALLLPARTQNLAHEHSILTTDCKSIRGHAARIVAEAGEPELNRDVAAAHLEQVARFHAEMEERLRIIGGLLTPAQKSLVETEYGVLQETCSALRSHITQLKKLFAPDAPDKSAIKSVALKLRNEMTRGNEAHERMKKKLGII